MIKQLTKYFAACLALLSVASCGKKYSEDLPLDLVTSPSVIISSQNGFVYALNPISGTKKWEFYTGSNVQATPFIMDNKIYVAAENGVLYKLDADRGTEIDRITFDNKQLLSSPIGDGAVIFQGCSDDTMRAFTVSNNSLKWKFGCGGAIVSSPTLFENKLIFGANDGTVYALDKDNGTLIWKYNAGGSFTSSPTGNGNFVYIGTSTGEMLSLRKDDGTVRWSFPTNSQPIPCSPLAYGGNVIFGSFDNNIYCIDTVTAQPRWVIKTSDRIISSPTANNQVVYIGGYDYKFYAIDIIQGNVKWVITTTALIKSSPVLYQDKVYFGGYDKILYAADTVAGNIVWKYNVNGLIETSPVIDTKTGGAIYPGISGAN